MIINNFIGGAAQRKFSATGRESSAGISVFQEKLLFAFLRGFSWKVDDTRADYVSLWSNLVRRRRRSRSGNALELIWIINLLNKSIPVYISIYNSERIVVVPGQTPSDIVTRDILLCLLSLQWNPLDPRTSRIWIAKRKSCFFVLAHVASWNAMWRGLRPGAHTKWKLSPINHFNCFNDMKIRRCDRRTRKKTQTNYRG